MTNDENTTDIHINDEGPIRHSGFVIHSSLGHLSFVISITP
jgi:hypothetical protein